MRFRVLGAVSYAGTDAWVQPSGQLRRRLLAVLLLHAGRRVGYGELAEALWPSEPATGCGNDCRCMCTGCDASSITMNG